jgi:hypothetical protein
MSRRADYGLDAPPVIRNLAIGIDLWQAADLGDNRPSATRENASREVPATACGW